jgi:hypothetical protein
VCINTSNALSRQCSLLTGGELRGQVLSFVLFLGVVGGGLYLWYRISDNSGDDGKGGGGRSDALSEAQKIMDKYK